MKNKIMIVSPTLFLGGAERVSVNLCNMLADDYEVSLVILDSTGKLKDSVGSNVNVIELQNKKASRSWFELSGIIKKENPNIVLSNTVRMNLGLLLGRLIRNSKDTVYICREPNEPLRTYESLPKIVTIISRYLYKHADLLIAQNEHMKELMCAFYGQNFSKKITVLKNPIFIDNTNLEKEKVTKDTFIYVGRLTKQKNVIRMIQAYIYARKHFDVTDSLLIYGEGEDRSKVEKVINENGMSQYIKLMEPTLDVHAVIQSSKALILISLWEGSPNVVWESLSLGTPVLVSPILPDYDETLGDKPERGFVLQSDPGDDEIVKELAYQLSVFENNPKIEFNFEPQNNSAWRAFFSGFLSK